jgi:hypothetical protein
MTKRICETCTFWMHILGRDIDQGQCSRYPPIPVSHKNNITTAFPVTFFFDRCGEWIECPYERPPIENEDE